jgi:hypothetical protein
LLRSICLSHLAIDRGAACLFITKAPCHCGDFWEPDLIDF